MHVSLKRLLCCALERLPQAHLESRRGVGSRRPHTEKLSMCVGSFSSYEFAICVGFLWLHDDSFRSCTEENAQSLCDHTVVVLQDYRLMPNMQCFLLPGEPP